MTDHPDGLDPPRGTAERAALHRRVWDELVKSFGGDTEQASLVLSEVGDSLAVERNRLRRDITEAIRQRDEAVRLLREAVAEMGSARAAFHVLFHDRPGFAANDTRLAGRIERADAFLANFKEDSTR